MIGDSPMETKKNDEETMRIPLIILSEPVFNQIDSKVQKQTTN